MRPMCMCKAYLCVLCVPVLSRVLVSYVLLRLRDGMWHVVCSVWHVAMWHVMQHVSNHTIWKLYVACVMCESCGQVYLKIVNYHSINICMCLCVGKCVSRAYVVVCVCVDKYVYSACVTCRKVLYGTYLCKLQTSVSRRVSRVYPYDLQKCVGGGAQRLQSLNL